jgi:predicted PurR-regulated permease PerM
MLPTGRKDNPLRILVMAVFTIAILYWGKPVLMPMAVALLLTFLLNPVVNALHRRGIWRGPAVLLVVLLVFTFTVTIAWSIGMQIGGLLEDLPDYKDNIRKKTAELKAAGKGGTLERINLAIEDLLGEMEEDQEGETGARAVTVPAEEKPVPVVVRGGSSARRLLPAALGPILEAAVVSGLVIVLVIFMLLRHQQLRNRLIRVVGYSRLTTTTKALDEAGERISKYLLMHTMLNASYGLAVSIGLFFIGLPYVALWGTWAFLMRFIPYVGPWLGAVLPIGFALVYFDGWMLPLLVACFIVTLELISNLFMEPLLYGHSAGVSEVALLVAIAFWTWLWGPIGLALATPLTVCIVVLCKYVPELEFVEVLMGDEPVMDAPLVLYQRLLSMDPDEAGEVVQNYLKTHSPELVFDDLLIPALNNVKQDAARGKLTEAEQASIYKIIRELVENLVPLTLKTSPMENPDERFGRTKFQVLGCPAYDDGDEVALLMLGRLLEQQHCQLTILSSQMLSSEVLGAVRQHNTSALIIASIPPDPISPARYLAKRLREHFPKIKILVGRWGFRGSLEETRDLLHETGADSVTAQLLDTRKEVLQLVQLFGHSQSKPLPVAEEPATATLHP